MKKNATTIALLVAILFVINLLSRQFFFRIDATEDRQYTLSQATKDVLGNLDDLVSVKVYFSKGLNPEFDRYRLEFQDMLVEYASLSRGNVDYQIVDPTDDQPMQEEALQSGIQPRLVSVRDKDQITQQRAFMGAVMTLGEQQEIIPFIGPGMPMEYNLTTNIKKMAIVDKPSIGFVQGHGEPGLAAVAQAAQALAVVFSVENVELASVDEIPLRYKTLVLLNPQDSIPPDEFAKLDGYINNGGKLVVAVNAVDGNLSNAQGAAVQSSVLDWLAQKGLVVEPSFVIDNTSGSVTVQQKQGFFTINTPVKFPYLPIVNRFGDHPVTKGLEQVIFQFVSPVRYAGTDGTFTPLVESSELSGLVGAPTFFNIEKQWSRQDFPLANVVIAGVLENMASSAGGKLLVFGDGDFPLGGQGRQVNQDNVNLLVNSIEWLSDDTGLSALRAKGVSSRPIDELEDSQRSLLKYLNFLLPVVLAIGYGIFRSQRNRNIRLRRMQERYV